MSPPSGPPFVVKAKLDDDKVVGARWWNEALASADNTAGRRAMLVAMGATGGAIAFAVGLSHVTSDDDDVESSQDALELQRRAGWNVGGTDRLLAFGGATRTDVDGGNTWQIALLDGPLDQVLRPADAGLQPFYDPTLFQSAAGPANKGLVASLSPISMPAMDEAFDRGRALADVLRSSGRPSGVGVIVDLPGPTSVAVAAGLAEAYAPVFAFGNWPHPLGVVASHLTLAAALYYLPLFRRQNVERNPPKPPAFILDANRLAPYRDETNEFDNRYLANVPSAESLKAVGVEQLLYIRPDGESVQELDDLNADFTSLQQAGIGVRAVALTDFQPDPQARPAPDAGVSGASTTSPRYYWGGSSYSHVYFWSHYGWGRPMPGRPVATVSRASAYRPVSRPTMFSSRAVGGMAGVGKQKPSGFGRVSVRTSRSSGAVTGVRTGRTGSFGRSRSFSSSSG